MTEDAEREDADQVTAAAREVLGLLRWQVISRSPVEMKTLPFLLLEAAEERHRQGDYGAERLLCEWADMLRDWEK
ncbi:hypothetical protein SAMN04244548_01212 [Paracoccus pantotrophus]|nr:hypothetical protein SAMN04244548_01212 [Paracoccus pantotrophus]